MSSKYSNSEALTAVIDFALDRLKRRPTEAFYASEVVKALHAEESEVKSALTALVKSGAIDVSIEVRCADCHRESRAVIERDGDLEDCPFCGESPHQQFVAFKFNDDSARALEDRRPKAPRRWAPLPQLFQRRLLRMPASIHSPTRIPNLKNIFGKSPGIREIHGR